jgi:RNA polymerase sigma factor (sigma-70 family)
VRNRSDGAVLRELDTLFNLGALRELTDGQLLERFSTGHGETAELAFAALVERHGAMVMRVCRARLSDVHDAHDAFQATFLILLKKSRALWVRDSLGPWLHQVAVRTASCARSSAARRRRHEHQAAPLTRDPEPSADLAPLLHEEINRLPERYRAPIVLCDLEGQTCEQVARLLGHPVGTIKSWRARGRERLRHLLIRRGLAPSVGLALLFAADAAHGTVLKSLTIQLTTETVSASVRTLFQGVLKTMLLAKLRATATIVFALGFLTAGLGTVARVGADDAREPVENTQRPPTPPNQSTQPTPLASPHADVAQENVEKPQPPSTHSDFSRLRPIVPPFEEMKDGWRLTLSEALRIGLSNSKGLLALKEPKAGESKAGIIITPRDDDEGSAFFNAEVMAKVRSIEQQYWTLSRVLVQKWATEKAVGLAAEILKREQRELKAGRGTVVDVADAQQRLDQFQIELETRTSDVVTTEQGLRNVLGLPLVDARRIVPITVPIEAKLEPNWEACKAEMLEKQPDIVRAKARLKEATVARIGDLDMSEKWKENLDHIVTQKTYSLARFVREVEGNHKQLVSTSRFRAAAAQRLEGQRAFYEEGRITIDRYLDAVSQYAAAVMQEANFKSGYNVSIVVLEEAKGTLLEYDGITVVDPSTDKWNTGNPIEPSALPARSDTPTREALGPSPVPIDAKRSYAAEPSPATSNAKSAGHTFSFHFTVGNIPKPVEIRGSFTIGPATTDSTKAVR